MNGKYDKVIIVDFDDTLILHDDSKEVDKGMPNKKLIEILNKLYYNHYIIKIYTSRGHYSASSREDADKKYRERIEKWLSDNGVKYHELSFQKPLAIYYIDDKALRPNEIDKLEELLC